MTDWKERPRYSQFDSDWRASGVKRRDVRATHDTHGREVTKPPSTHKKDTKRWCRGKVGQEHDFVFSHSFKFFSTTRVFRCTRCGKRDWRHG